MLKLNGGSADRPPWVVALAHTDHEVAVALAYACGGMHTHGALSGAGGATGASSCDVCCMVHGVRLMLCVQRVLDYGVVVLLIAFNLFLVVVMEYTRLVRRHPVPPLHVHLRPEHPSGHPTRTASPLLWKASAMTSGDAVRTGDQGPC